MDPAGMVYIFYLLVKLYSHMGAARRGFLQIFLALTHGKISPENQ
jgi:hypothetical protein